MFIIKISRTNTSDKIKNILETSSSQQNEGLFLMKHWSSSYMLSLRRKQEIIYWSDIIIHHEHSPNPIFNNIPFKPTLPTLKQTNPKPSHNSPKNKNPFPPLPSSFLSFFSFAQIININVNVHILSLWTLSEVFALSYMILSINVYLPLTMIYIGGLLKSKWKKLTRRKLPQEKIKENHNQTQ